MHEQHKLLRILTMIALLRQSPHSLRQLSRQFEVSERTIYRYINLLKDVGFQVDQNQHGEYEIITADGKDLKQEDMIFFTVEEAHVLKDLVASLDSSHGMRERLINKLATLSGIEIGGQIIADARKTNMIRNLVHALQEEKKVAINNYSSMQSQSTRDRKVEPVNITNDFNTLIALDLEDKQLKHFKISRMGNVQILPEQMEHHALHQPYRPDPFGMAGNDSFRVVMELSERACHLMLEEYPRSRKMIYQENNTYYFDGEVKGLEGIGRFVLGLISEVTILEPVELRAYVNDKIRRYQRQLNQ